MRGRGPVGLAAVGRLAGVAPLLQAGAVLARMRLGAVLPTRLLTSLGLRGRLLGTGLGAAVPSASPATVTSSRRAMLLALSRRLGFLALGPCLLVLSLARALGLLLAVLRVLGGVGGVRPATAARGLGGLLGCGLVRLLGVAAARLALGCGSGLPGGLGRHPV